MPEDFSKDYVYKKPSTALYRDPAGAYYTDVESGGYTYADDMSSFMSDLAGSIERTPIDPAFVSDLSKELSDLHSQIIAMNDKVNLLQYISNNLEMELDKKTNLDEHEEVKKMVEELKADILEKEKSSKKKEKSPRASMICLPITKKEYNALGAAVAYLKENDTLKGICADLEDMYNRVEL